MANTRDLPVIVELGREEALLQAADVIIGQRCTRRRARLWLAAVHQRYPGCRVVVAHHVSGKWCLVNSPGRLALVQPAPGRRLDPTAAAVLGGAAYRSWHMRKGTPRCEPSSSPA